MEEAKSELNAALDELAKGQEDGRDCGSDRAAEAADEGAAGAGHECGVDASLGLREGQAEGRGSGNNRKKVQGDEPQILPKHERRWRGFDDKIVSLYARGMSTEEVMEEVRGWQSRPWNRFT